MKLLTIVLFFLFVSASEFLAGNTYRTDECRIQIQGDVKNVSCKGLSDGTIDLIITGEGMNLFLWSNGSTSEDLTSLNAGSYSVTVSNSQCSVSDSFTVNEPEPILLELKNKKEETCYNSADGILIVAGLGGIPPYQFSIDKGLTFISSETFRNLNGGFYEIMVKDFNGCLSTLPVEIQSPPSLKIDLGGDRSVVSGTEFLIDAGKGFINYLWNTGETTQSVVISREVKETVVEEFFVQVTDSYGCHYTSEKLRITLQPDTQKSEEISRENDHIMPETKEVTDENSDQNKTESNTSDTE